VFDSCMFSQKLQIGYAFAWSAKAIPLMLGIPCCSSGVLCLHMMCCAVLKMLCCAVQGS
jgi:hypothetical protein